MESIYAFWLHYIYNLKFILMTVVRTAAVGAALSACLTACACGNCIQACMHKVIGYNISLFTHYFMMTKNNLQFFYSKYSNRLMD